MKMLSKKSCQTIAALVAGAFIMAGVAVVAGPLAVQAGSAINERPAQHQCKEVSPEKAAEHLATSFGLDQQLVLKYHSQGTSFRNLRRAAFLATASGKAFEEVLALKTDTNTWKDVTNTLGVTKEQLKATRQELAAKRIADKLELNQADILTLLKQGYHSRDVAAAAVLAKHSDKSTQQLLDMKKINNTWRDVANDLGIDKEVLKQDMGKFGMGQHRHKFNF